MVSLELVRKLSRKTRQREPAGSLSSFHFQMVSAQLLPLDAPKRAIGDLLLRQAIVDHMNRKPAAQIPEHGDALNPLASRPHAELLQAVSRQVPATYTDRMLDEPPWAAIRFVT
jgi:hypothetical protein